MTTLKCFATNANVWALVPQAVATFLTSSTRVVTPRASGVATHATTVAAHATTAGTGWPTTAVAGKGLAHSWMILFAAWPYFRTIFAPPRVCTITGVVATDRCARRAVFAGHAITASTVATVVTTPSARTHTGVVATARYAQSVVLAGAAITACRRWW